MQIFEVDLSLDEIYKKMSGSIPDINFVPGETLIFLDEIHCCGNARTVVKFLAEDFGYDVVLSVKEISSYRPFHKCIKIHIQN